MSVFGHRGHVGVNSKIYTLISRFIEDKFNVSISTDDPGVFGNSITANYRMCFEKFNLNTKLRFTLIVKQ